MQVPATTTQKGRSQSRVGNIDQVRAQQHHRENLAQVQCFDRAHHRLGPADMSEHGSAVIHRDDRVPQTQQQVGNTARAGTQLQNPRASRHRAVNDVRFRPRRQQPIHLDGTAIRSDHTGTTAADEGTHLDKITETSQGELSDEEYRADAPSMTSGADET